MNDITKWYPIIDNFYIKEEFREKIATHLEKIASLEYLNNDLNSSLNVLNSTSTFTKSLLPMELKIISKIFDLSKVKFVPNIEFVLEDNEVLKVDTFINECSHQRNSFELLNTNALELINYMEDHIIQQIADKINELIKENHIVYIYILVNSNILIAEGTLAPKMVIKSMYTSKKYYTV